MNDEENQTLPINRINFLRNITHNKSHGPIEAFELLIKEIFLNYSDLSSSNEEYKDKLIDLDLDYVLKDSHTISKTNFLKYFQNLPIIFSEKLFNCLDIKKRGCLTYDEFSRLFITMKYANEDEEILRFIFSIFAYELDDKEISVSDIKLLLSYIPFKSKIYEKDNFNYQLENILELDKLIEETFSKLTKVNYDEFFTLMCKKSELLLLLFNYLYVTIPAFQKSLLFYISAFLNSSNSLSNSTFSSSNYRSRGISVNCSIEAFSKNEYMLTKIPERKFITHDVTKLGNPKLSTSFGNHFDKKLQSSDIIKTKISNEESVRQDQDVSINFNTVSSEKSEKSTIFDDIYKKEIIEEEEDDKLNLKYDTSKLNNSNDSEVLDDQVKLTVTYEDYIYIMHSSLNKSRRESCDSDIKEIKKKDSNKESNTDSNNKDTKKDSRKNSVVKEILLEAPVLNYVRLIDDNLYLYKQKDDKIEDFYKTIFVSGSNLKEIPKKTIQGESYHSFIIFLHNNLEETVYTKTEKGVKDLIKVLRDCTNYKNFFKNYNLLSILGEGTYGEVFVSEDMKSKVKVATKIIKKNNDKQDYWKRIKTEIDVLKIVNHPNIVKFVENYENSEYYFIVMEYLKYGSLTTFLQYKSFKVKEKTIARITYQIALALEYLHDLGIIHRDLKADNILISVDDRTSEKDIRIKLTDFGLAKILSKFETTTECCGSILFSAPELLYKKNYAASVDIWSLGINIFYFLTGSFPFKIYKEKDKVLKSICHKDFSFDLLLKRSVEVKDLIKKCLVKDVTKRLTISEVLSHPWFDNVRNEFK